MFLADSLRTYKGCEPTYKELKHLVRHLDVVKQTRCEPTYKELKQKFY